MWTRAVVATFVGASWLAACGGSGASIDETDREEQDDIGAPKAEDPRGGGDFPGEKTDGAAPPPTKACSTDQECGEGGVCIAETKTCSCGAERVAAGLVAPNFLVVLDRSCSMKTEVSNKTTKWQIAVGTLTGFMAKNAGAFRFGLELFPDITGDACTQDGLSFAPGPGNETKIESLLMSALDKGNTYYPNGPCVTNLHTAMTTAAAEPALQDPTRRSFVVLISDGSLSLCNGKKADREKMVSDTIKSMRTNQVGTFVIGFGKSVDSAALDMWAEDGGHPRKGAAHKYFDAADQAGLDAAFKAIAGEARSCSFQLAAPPPGDDAGLIFVFLGKGANPLPRDASRANGWDYEPANRTVTLYGAQCEAVKAAASEDVNIVFGCPGGAVPTNPVN